MAAFIIAQHVSAVLVQEVAQSSIAAVAGQLRRQCGKPKHLRHGMSVLTCRASLQLSRIRASIKLGGSAQTAASYNKPLVPTCKSEALLHSAQRQRSA
jgi:hypothetical protein